MITKLMTVVNHGEGENIKETEVRMIHTGGDGSYLVIKLGNDEARHFPVNSRAKLTIEPEVNLAA